MTENNIQIRDAVISNRNFSGRPEKPYNPQGKRCFTVVLDEETSNVLIHDGWNVNMRESQDPDQPPVGFMSVSVQFDSKMPPKIMQITRKGGKVKRTPITESTVSLIDNAEIKDVKLEIRPYNWEFNGKSGVRAYLKTMYFELVEDCFESEYDFDDFEEMPFDLE